MTQEASGSGAASTAGGNGATSEEAKASVDAAKDPVGGKDLRPASEERTSRGGGGASFLTKLPELARDLVRRVPDLVVVVWILTWCIASGYCSMGTLSAYQLSDELRQDGFSPLADEAPRLANGPPRGPAPAGIGIGIGIENELPRRQVANGSKLAMFLRFTDDSDELKKTEAQLMTRLSETEKQLEESIDRSARAQVDSVTFQTELVVVTDLRTKLARLEDQRAEIRRRQTERDAILQSGPLLLAHQTVKGMNAFNLKTLLPLTPDLLTLILAMAMGVLGASLRSLRDFLVERHDRTFLWFIFRPPLGMITAFSVLVLFKAGQLSITAGPPGTLNPYVISFVALVSGILADEAYDRLRSAGHSVFGRGRDGSTDRWAVHVKDALDAKGKKLEDLASLVGRKYASELQLWLDEKKPVPPEYQRLIAVWLGTPAWRLFTDFSPAERDGHESTEDA